MDGYQRTPARQQFPRRGETASSGPEWLEREKGSRAAWDLNELLERLDGDQELLRDLLEIFRNDGRTNLEKAQSQRAEGDLLGLSRTAHTLKGMLRNLAMGAAADAAAALEEAAGGGNEEQSAELMAKLEKELAEILPEVEARLAGAKS